jgi:hypothetical protein
MADQKNHEQGIEAPDDFELGGISQLEDHSELTTLYPKPKAQWSGEIMTSEQREAKRQAEQKAIITSIRPEFLKIGLMVPLPLVVGTFIANAAFMFITDENTAFLILPLIVVFIAWVFFTIRVVRSVVRIFYNHALAAWPFLLVTYSLLALTLQSSFALINPTYESIPFLSLAVASLNVFIISVIASFLLLTIWVTDKLRVGMKLTIISILVAAFIGFTVFSNLV